MALPASLNLETVADGPFLDTAGNPLKGSFSVVGSEYRRVITAGGAVGAVLAPAQFALPLDAAGNVSRQLPANRDVDIQVDDVYTVTPNLTDSAGAALAKAFPPFQMALYAGGGPYRLSDFMFGAPPPPPSSGAVDNGDGTFTLAVADPGDGTFMAP